jgi:methylenetetrahydrofolate reductase (NADPH)
MSLQQRIESGSNLVVAEVSPPQSGNPGPLHAAVKQYAGQVHALGISDNQYGVCMSALAAAALVAQAGVEPILHVVTRDRNRTALVADYLGAQALGIGNVLCTTGTHQTLGPARAARAVFDLDSIQLLETYAGLATDGSVVGATNLNGAAPLCLGAVASPFADPPELQLIRLAKKAQAGARFAITQPVFDVDRFAAWWKQVTQRRLEQRLAILAGIRVLTSAEDARSFAGRRPRPAIPESILARVTSQADPKQQRAAGIELAIETIERLRELPGLRGFELRGSDDDAAALEVIAKSGIGAH